MATCAVPPPVVREQRLSDCDKCKRCLAWATVFTADPDNTVINNGLTLATAFLPVCTTNLTANDVVKCKNLAGAIAFSYNGNLAKRAGALCSRLGDCGGEAATSKCNVTEGKQLDLCTAEGWKEPTDPIALVLPDGGEGVKGACTCTYVCLLGCQQCVLKPRGTA
jgi:hypothetical protein